MDLFDWEEQWQVFVLENLLIAKNLFDKGFNEAMRLDPETGNFNLVAQILFGEQNVKNEPFELVLSPEQEHLLEAAAKDEQDEYLGERVSNLSEFQNFYHYKLEIMIPGLNLLWPNQVKNIEEGFKTTTYTFDEWEHDSEFHEGYPCSINLAGAGWLLEEQEKVGIWFHTVSNDYDNAGPAYERTACEFLIRVWDALRVARAFHIRRKSLTFKRLILFSGGNSYAQDQHKPTLLRIKEDPAKKAELRRRNRALARDQGRDYDA